MSEALLTVESIDVYYAALSYNMLHFKGQGFEVVPVVNFTPIDEERTLQLAHAALNAKREYGSRLVVFRKGVEARSRSDKPNTREVINAVALNSTTERADGERVEVANRSEMTNAREAISAVLRACKLPLPHQ